MNFEALGAIIFIVLLSALLYHKRKAIDVQGIFPFFYFAMLRTKLGLKYMDKIANKFPRTVKVMGYVGIVVGFLGMALLSVELFHNLYKLFFIQEAVPGVVPVLPIKAKGIFYVPFFYWIISIFIIAVIHEFSHGVVARVHKIKVKSSGFAFLGILLPVIPAAFVEPEEKNLTKKKAKQQLAVFAAGPFSNVVLAFLCLGLFIGLGSAVSNHMIENTGIEITDYYIVDNVTSPAQDVGIAVGEVITKINGVEMLTVQEFQTFLNDNVKAHDMITVSTDKNADGYSVTLKEKPGDGDDAYLGVYVKQASRTNQGFEEKYGAFIPAAIIWFLGLLYWLYLLNLGIGIFNLVPIGPIDGGRMLKTALESSLKNKKLALAIWKYVSLVFLAILLTLLLFGFVR